MAIKDEQTLRNMMSAQRDQLLNSPLEDPLARVEILYQLWWRWADFELTILSPSLPIFKPPIVLSPEFIQDTNELEFVYPITDYGYKFCTSKGEEMISSGTSMYKMHCTIEKIVALLIERLDKQGISSETEVLVAFGGHELSQRKCFEIIINLSKHNLVVTNFDPGSWGEEYLRRVKRLVDLGYGYPPEAPRDTYRQAHQRITPKQKTR